MLSCGLTSDGVRGHRWRDGTHHRLPEVSTDSSVYDGIRDAFHQGNVVQQGAQKYPILTNHS